MSEGGKDSTGALEPDPQLQDSGDAPTTGSGTGGATFQPIRESTALGIGEHAEAIPVPSIAHPPTVVRGRSLGRWGIERRRTAKLLLNVWQSVEAAVQTPDFPVLADGFVERVETEMTRFDGIPGEDFFSAILQRIRDSLTGPSFERACRGEFGDAISAALVACSNAGELTLEDFDEALRPFVTAGFTPRE